MDKKVNIYKHLTIYKLLKQVEIHNQFELQSQLALALTISELLSFFAKSIYHFQISKAFFTFPKYVLGTPWIVKKRLPIFSRQGLLVRKKKGTAL